MGSLPWVIHFFLRDVITDELSDGDRLGYNRGDKEDSLHAATVGRHMVGWSWYGAIALVWRLDSAAT